MDKEYVDWNPTGEQLIRRLRVLMLIHSHLYYRLNTSIISDAQFDKWAKELAEIPHKEIGFYDTEFKGWDGSSGYHLPYSDYIHNKATWLLNYIERKQDENRTN